MPRNQKAKDKLHEIRMGQKEFNKMVDEIIDRELAKRGDRGHITSDEVKKVMCEEYGVAKVVIAKTHEVCGWVETAMVGRKGIPMDDSGTMRYVGSLTMDCFGRKVTVEYDITNYASKGIYEALCPKDFGGEVDSGKVLRLRLAAVNKKVTKESYGAIQHELHHLYESVMADSGKSLGNHNDRDMYEKALANLNILKARNYSEKNDNVRYLLNLAVYYSLDSEIRAYANTLDSYVRDHGAHDAEGVKKSDTYKALWVIKSVLSVWTAIEAYVGEEFGVDGVVCRDMLSRGKEGYVKSIGRILAKYDMEAINEDRYLSYNVNWYDGFGRIFDELDSKVSQFGF